MATTFTKIASVTVDGSGPTSITFSSIPNTYTDLVVLHSTRCTAASNSLTYNYNGSTASQTYRLIYGDGGAVGTETGTNQFAYTTASVYTANTFANGSIYIPNYNSGNNKSSSSDAVNENNATGAYSVLAANLWANTAAITSVALVLPTGAFAQYSTAVLYGISKS
jgi:hypothetical protein